MAKKRKRGRKMPAWRKWARAILGGVGAGVIIAGASHGVIRTAQQHGADVASYPGSIVAFYTGMDPRTGTFDANLLIQSIVTILGSLVAGKTIKAAARSV